MTTIPDEELDLHSDRVKGKVVVITGMFFQADASLGLSSLDRWS